MTLDAIMRPRNRWLNVFSHHEINSLNLTDLTKKAFMCYDARRAEMRIRKIIYLLSEKTAVECFSYDKRVSPQEVL